MFSLLTCCLPARSQVFKTVRVVSMQPIDTLVQNMHDCLHKNAPMELLEALAADKQLFGGDRVRQYLKNLQQQRQQEAPRRIVIEIPG